MTTHEISPLAENLQGVIITDCHDANAQARQQVRFTSLFGVKPAFIELGAGDNADLEAAGHLADVLDAIQTPSGYPETPAVVLVNVAPRGDDVRGRWENGTPFCYAEIGNALVVSAYEGKALSLVRKLGQVSTAHLLDIPAVTQSLIDSGSITAREAHRISNTQFRSLEFLPLAAYEIASGNSLPSEELAVESHQNIEGLAWFIDNFGNVKTTLLPEDINFQEGQTIQLAGGQKATAYERLTDVPTGEFGITIGSSGYGEDRWLEVVQQRGRAADALSLGIGSQILDVA